MASGRKNYFRHSFFARNDDFINELIDEFGLSGYYYYFALIEICAEQSADFIPDSYKFHKRTLIQNLRLNTRKLNLFLEYLQDKCKISYTLTKNQYEIIFPNLSKYLGKYTSKNELNTSNKKKEKEKKRKEIKTIQKNYSLDELIKKWNGAFSDGSTRKIILPSPTMIRRFKEITEFADMAMIETAFGKLTNSDFLTGKQGNFHASLEWFLEPEKFCRVLNGDYDNNSGTNPFESLESI